MRQAIDPVNRWQASKAGELPEGSGPPPAQRWSCAVEIIRQPEDPIIAAKNQKVSRSRSQDLDEALGQWICHKEKRLIFNDLS
ncbi:hypothetical protein LB529_20530 [Mesorhizobium sp. CA5]|nr:hypothetical protein [Mesorhizobium sp. CA5]